MFILFNVETHWLYKKNRKKFFEDFAAAYHFDPLNVNNWYSITKDNLLNYKKVILSCSLFWLINDYKKGANDVLEYYKGNHEKAILELFPELLYVPSYLKQGN